MKSILMLMEIIVRKQNCGYKIWKFSSTLLKIISKKGWQFFSDKYDIEEISMVYNFMFFSLHNTYANRGYIPIVQWKE